MVAVKGVKVSSREQFVRSWSTSAVNTATVRLIKVNALDVSSADTTNVWHLA